MNSNNLRIKGSDYRTRGGITFDALIISEPITYEYSRKDMWKNFVEANAEEQVNILKDILKNSKNDCDIDTIHFLVTIYLQSESKHPAKGMITRYVTKNECIKEQFSEILTQELKHLIQKHYDVFQKNKNITKSYKDIVSKIANCTENFPSGAAAVKNIEIMLATYFKECLENSISTIQQDLCPLSPTEKNEIYNLMHTTLRLLLYIIQKVSNDNVPQLITMFDKIRIHLKEVLFDTDAPMDTKSVCGIVYISIHILEHSSDSWLQILESKQNSDIQNMLLNESAKLSLYSALVTVVPMEKLQTELSDGEPAIVKLTNKILDIAERCSSESTFILGATRTIVQICKGLPKMASAGVRLLDALLMFVWTHLEHYTDSVKHLTAQALGQIIKYCVALKRAGKEEALERLMETLGSLDRTRKSFYVSVSRVAAEMGPDFVLSSWPHIVRHMLAVLQVQAVQASATTCLETLLQKYAQKSNTESIYVEWVEPILSHVANNELDSSVLNVLEGLLTLAIKCDANIMSYILPYIRERSEQNTHSVSDMKCLLMLLSVVRASGVGLGGEGEEEGGRWKGVVRYDVLNSAAIHSTEENRILSISLIVESPRTTEAFSKEELVFVRWFLLHNMNTQAPHYRQLVLSLFKKFLKRLENSYKSIIRDNDPDSGINKGQYYLSFLDELRNICFEGLTVGANYSRRYVALQILAWMEKLQMDGYKRIWKESEIDILLHHLGDSYESNKALALELLQRYPKELFQGKKFKTSLELRDIIAEASSVKPTDCVTAVYKMMLLLDKLPENITAEDCCEPERVRFALVCRLAEEARRQRAECARSLVRGARGAPMYGVLHCLSRILQRPPPLDLEAAGRWELLVKLVEVCEKSCECSREVLASAAPEGAMPVPEGDITASGNIRFEDGMEVTAQMVLLCAWRTVKEVSQVLASVASLAVSSLKGRGSGKRPEAREELVARIGERFLLLLAETKHRGAFEQLYVGFTALLTCLWNAKDTGVSSLPARWLQEQLALVGRGGGGCGLSATRRSAGLPFVIQALVITELQVAPGSRSVEQAMGLFLSLARDGASLEARCHSLNVLRALFRHSQLENAVAGFVGEGLQLALDGFRTDTWIERNSATLLLSALVVRVFGVSRCRRGVSSRNRMTGRVFFLRYPRLYDYLLNKLLEASESNDEQIRPWLQPVLLLLARLYPSALEGTVSNLKLVAFAPLVGGCSRGASLHARRLAAQALPPLVAPQQYISYIESMFEKICDRYIKRNYCHGVLLQLLELIDAKPEDLTIDEEAHKRLIDQIQRSSWVLEQCLGEMPCYLLADEYIKMFNMLISRFKALITDDFTDHIQIVLNDIIFKESKCQVNPGKELCQANAVYLKLIIHSYKQTNTQAFVYECLSHRIYEVVLAALNYLLVIHNEVDLENNLLEHLSEVCNKSAMDTFKNDTIYREKLCAILKSKYLECQQKSLKLLTLEEGHQKNMIEAKLQTSNATDELILTKLIHFIENEHENLMAIYLGSLCGFVDGKLKKQEIDVRDVLRVLRVVFECSLSDNNDEVRSQSAHFLARNLHTLLNLPLRRLDEEERFEFSATLYATIVSVLEDDLESLRLVMSRAITSQHVIASAATSRVIELASGHHDVTSMREGDDVKAPEHDSDGVMTLAVIALLDFRAEVCMNDDVNDESRVFDQNEKYNVYLEETIWTCACADAIRRMLGDTSDICQYISQNINQKKYISTFAKLCNDNVTLFRKAVNGESMRKMNEINPKIDLFIERLRR